MTIKSRGQMLVEVLVAIAVITTALTFSLAAAINAQKNARVARDRLEASKYAEKVLEDLRNDRDADQNSFFANAVCGSCGPFGENGLYACQLSCIFQPTSVEATVQISWEEGGNTAEVNVTTVLTKYDL